MKFRQVSEKDSGPELPRTRPQGGAYREEIEAAIQKFENLSDFGGLGD